MHANYKERGLHRRILLYVCHRKSTTRRLSATVYAPLFKKINFPPELHICIPVLKFFFTNLQVFNFTLQLRSALRQSTARCWQKKNCGNMFPLRSKIKKSLSRNWTQAFHMTGEDPYSNRLTRTAKRWHPDLPETQKCEIEFRGPRTENPQRFLVLTSATNSYVRNIAKVQIKTAYAHLCQLRELP